MPHGPPLRRNAKMPAQKTGENGERMGEIWSNTGEKGHLEKNAAQTAAILWQQRQGLRAIRERRRGAGKGGGAGSAAAPPPPS